MPKLPRHDYYDTASDINWAFGCVPKEEVVPEELPNSFGIEYEKWWDWDESCTFTYRKYVHNQARTRASIQSARRLPVPICSTSWTKVGNRR